MQGFESVKAVKVITKEKMDTFNSKNSYRCIKEIIRKVHQLRGKKESLKS